MARHYCRSKANRQYVASDLNITKIYELYLDKCKEENVSDPVSAAVYRKTFCSEYNFTFHRPKKDGCSTYLCGGQNCCMCTHAVKTPRIEIIDQNVLETGHTDMEVDSMHSAIEANKKHQRIYTSHGWPVILRIARQKHPYHVEELSFNDILNLKALKATLTVGKMFENTEGNTINWMNIKMLQFRKDCPQIIFVKENHSDENFTEMSLPSSKNKK
ncbi:hypothetical protein ILUMI_26770 [Ignelater luminosus]|uniref:Uncharacterized protein n=1 Tax=Ignelater luminosus TaxID=2038154 RepID=A0A8K0C7T7_IGNLU|nr:hypothetical protein ILUMI_26770 [Ignelater luminosus]